MVTETYTCACEGYTEFGWTIKESHDHDDALYDIIIGTVSYDTPDDQAVKEIEAAWERTRKAAEAFAAAL
jgi:hypothetical protein